MRLRFDLAVFATTAIVLSGPLIAFDPELPPELVLLAKIKRKASQDLSHVPSFTCLATFDRAERRDDAKPFMHVDTVRAEIAYVNGQELYAWPGSKSFDGGTFAQIVGAGLVGSGEFLSHARTVFVSDAGSIVYGGAEEYAGRPAVRYDFSISPLFSGYHITVPEGSATIGMKGSFWADRNSLDLLALIVRGTEIPARLGVRSIETQIDYQRVHVGRSSTILLPLSAVTTLAHDSGKTNRNQIEYTHCREYLAVSAVSFDRAGDDLKPENQRPAADAEIILPALLVVNTRLRTPIDSATAVVGDAISAVVESDVRQKGKLVIPAGAILTGRVRVLQKDGPDRFIIGLEFTDLTFEDKHGRFIAELQHLDPTGGVQMLESNKLATNERTILSPDTPHGSIEIERRETHIPPQLPGVATFFVLKTKRFELAAGLRMEWRTGPLRKGR
jgi:hypothetical protein